MDPITLGIIMGGLGMANDMTTGAQKRAQKAQYDASEWQASPWTGVHPSGAPEQGNPLGKGLEAGVSGVGLGQQIQSQEAAKNLYAALGEKLGGTAATQNAAALRQNDATMNSIPTDYAIKSSYFR